MLYGDSKKEEENNPQHGLTRGFIEAELSRHNVLKGFKPDKLLSHSLAGVLVCIKVY